jgi:hypothetical protein
MNAGDFRRVDIALIRVWSHGVFRDAEFLGRAHPIEGGWFPQLPHRHNNRSIWGRLLFYFDVSGCNCPGRVHLGTTHYFDAAFRIVLDFAQTIGLDKVKFKLITEETYGCAA